MIKKMIRQIEKLAGKKGTKIEYNPQNNTILVTFYPSLWATSSEVADFFQSNLQYIDEYCGHFRVDKIRTRDKGLLSCIELNVPTLKH